MTTYRTGNPIGSTDPKDLYDNAENTDVWVNSLEREYWDDRFGRNRKTVHGMEKEFDDDQIKREKEFVVSQTSRKDRFNDFIASSGYSFLGDYAAGIEITEYNQVLRDSDGEFWRLSGQVELPYTTTGAGLPEDVAFVSVGDAALRQELSNDIAAWNENSQFWEALGSRQITPTLSPIDELVQIYRTAHIQDANGDIYAAWSRTGGSLDFQKSTDGGRTWRQLSVLPSPDTSRFAKLTNGTIICIAGTRMWRSIDDGVTWNETFPGLNFPPLSNQGICEGTDGSVMIAEYGNVGQTVYRIMRSRDDGITWSSVFETSGLEPSGDPGHIHSITFDTFAQRHVIFVDRPMSSSWGGPRIYYSEDNGDTWILAGESRSVDDPNFVSPMYFSEYVAWGSDNQINGRISRIRREDFYAGNFHKSETVAMLSQKAMYFTFPLRPNVWAVSMAGEHISSSQQDDEHGSSMNEVWLVSDNGALVSGGMESFYNLIGAGDLSGVRAHFPHYRYNVTNHHGVVWANMPQGRPRQYAAVPATQGVEPPSKRVGGMGVITIPFGGRVDVVTNTSGETQRGVIERFSNSYTTIGNNNIGSAHIRILDNGTMEFRSGSAGSPIARITSGGMRMILHGGSDFTTTGVGVYLGSGNPNGTVDAPVGSIYMAYGGGGIHPLWTKSSGDSSSGWREIGYRNDPTTGPTSSRPSNPLPGSMHFDTTLNILVWYVGGNWRDAGGEIA